ncbi:MAG: HAD family hydrolase [Bacteroidia bacterium]
MDHLYVTDLDGTLLRSGARLSDYARKVLTRLLADGLPLTIATARSITSVRQILGDLPITLPIICGNGAYMAYLNDEKHWFTNPIPKPKDERILDHILDHKLDPFVSAYNGTANRLFMTPKRNAGTQWYWDDRKSANDHRLQEVSDLKSGLAHQVLSFNIIGLLDSVLELQSSLESEYAEELNIYMYEAVHTGEWHWLSVYDMQATKARGIELVLGHIGLNASQLTVFGDNDNDLSMFRYAGNPVAVANAKPAILSLAKEVIGPNETDSVVDYLRHAMDS